MCTLAHLSTFVSPSSLLNLPRSADTPTMPAPLAASTSLSDIPTATLRSLLAPVTSTKGKPAAFQNWATTYKSQTRATFRPRSVEEVRWVVELARREGVELRASGSGHSPSDLVCTDGYIVNIDRVEGVLEVSRVGVGCGARRIMLTKPRLLPNETLAFARPLAHSSSSAPRAIAPPFRCPHPLRSTPPRSPSTPPAGPSSRRFTPSSARLGSPSHRSAPSRTRPSPAASPPPPMAPASPLATSRPARPSLTSSCPCPTRRSCASRATSA